jgi:hypothetical protein
MCVAAREKSSRNSAIEQIREQEERAEGKNGILREEDRKRQEALERRAEKQEDRKRSQAAQEKRRATAEKRKAAEANRRLRAIEEDALCKERAKEAAAAAEVEAERLAAQKVFEEAAAAAAKIEAERVAARKVVEEAVIAKKEKEARRGDSTMLNATTASGPKKAALPPSVDPIEGLQVGEIPPACDPCPRHAPPRAAHRSGAREWSTGRVTAWARENKVAGVIVQRLAQDDVNGDDLLGVFRSVQDVQNLLLADGDEVSKVKMASFLRKVEALRT